jgi:RNA polymerase sigma-70 factor (ECF subfamily)
VKELPKSLSFPALLEQNFRPVEENPPIAQPYGEMDAPSRPAGPAQGVEAGDAELLRRVYAGDQGAFRTLVDRHGRYLTGVATALCGNRADAEDLVQETFVAALTSRFRGESSARTWLVQILVRRSAMLRRSRKREQGQPLAGAAERSSRSEVAGTDAKLDLARMLEGLSPDQRQVIVLRELEGLTYEEMAAALHVPRGTVESRLHRARAALKQLFRGYL